MAEIAARRGEGLRELRGLDLSRRFKEESREDESFKKTEIVGGEYARGESLEAARCTVDGEHGAFAEEGVDAHGGWS